MLKIVAIAAAVLVALLVVFTIWRWASVGRGMGQRDEKLLVRLDPIAKKIETGQAVSPQEIEVLAARPETRFMLFAMLRDMKRPDLLPTRYSSSVAQGESASRILDDASKRVAGRTRSDRISGDSQETD